MNQIKSIRVQHFGPISEGRVTFGDLTLFVGPQATGKSLLLQLLKLLLDVAPIRAELKRFNMRWKGLENFLELYFGEGMSGVYSSDSVIEHDDRTVRLEEYVRRGGTRQTDESLFYIPAQRVVTIREGLTRPFTDYRAGDPFVVREFSEKLHQLIQSEFGQARVLFPQPKRLKKEYRDLIEKHIFRRFGLETDVEGFQRRMVLGKPGSKNLPFLVWSAGQREFVPLLLGLYWLLPPTKPPRREKLRWVVIEESEMGLHPYAVSVVMTLVLELLARGYRLCLSTHSPHVLDVVWAMQEIRKHGAQERDLLEMLDLPSTGPTRNLVRACLDKRYTTFFFAQTGEIKDITGLDPAAVEDSEAGWGGLTEFSGKVAGIVSKVVARTEEQAPVEEGG